MKRITLFVFVVFVSTFTFGQNAPQNPFEEHNKSELLLREYADELNPRVFDFKSKQRPLLKSQSTQKEQLDSVIYMNRDSDTSQLGINFKYIFTYDINGNQTSFIEVLWNSTTRQWDNNKKVEYSYDANGKTTSSVSSNWISNQWDNNKKAEYSYDANGKTTSSVSSNWISNQWQYTQKIEYAYDIYGHETSFICSDWNSTKIQWKVFRKLESTFDDNGNMTCKIDSGWNRTNGQFENCSKYEYSYDANGNLTTDINSKNWITTGQLDNAFRHQYAYDGNGNITIKIGDAWDVEKGEWYYVNKSEYTYNAGKKSCEIHSKWSFATGKSELDFKDEYIYDVNGNRTSFIHSHWDTPTNHWVFSCKEEITCDLSYGLNDLYFPLPTHINSSFDITDKIVDHHVYQYIDDSWVNSEKETYYYSTVKTVPRDYVDLGLPSGTMWATSNVGAINPEESGDYYAWGETEAKDAYIWETYKYKVDGQTTAGTEYLLINGHSIQPGESISGTQYDVAHVKWGNNWVMPDTLQVKELLSSCVRTKEENYNGTGVSGDLYTGPNGNTIFLPYAGPGIGVAEYWAANLYKNKYYGINFESIDLKLSMGWIYVGRSVRPVKPSTTINMSVCDSVIWENQKYTNSGTYYKTIKDSKNNDSLLVLKLTINKSISLDTFATATNQYVWHENIYTLSGRYADTLKTSCGCDSIIYLNLTIPRDTLIITDNDLYLDTVVNNIDIVVPDSAGVLIPPGVCDTINSLTSDYGAVVISGDSVLIKNLLVKIPIERNKWYLFYFPFDLNLDDVDHNCKLQIDEYNGNNRALHGDDNPWENLSDSSWLSKWQGYHIKSHCDDTLYIHVKNLWIDNVSICSELQQHSTGETRPENADWNAVGNPYWSYFDLHDVAFEGPIVIWNWQTQNYQALTRDDVYRMLPFEGFMAQLQESGSCMNFNADNRQTINGIKPAQDNENWDGAKHSPAKAAAMTGRVLIDLMLANGESSYDQTRIVFNDAKSVDYERDCDAPKFMADSVIQFYSFGESVSYAINERPVNDGLVSLGFKVPKAGKYFISTSEYDIKLIDNDSSKIHILGVGSSYSFISEEGLNETRFKVQYLPDAVTTIESSDADIKLYVDGTRIICNTVFHVYDMFGRDVSDWNGSLPQGVYIVKTEKTAQKVVVK